MADDSKQTVLEQASASLKRPNDDNSNNSDDPAVKTEEAPIEGQPPRKRVALDTSQPASPSDPLPDANDNENQPTFEAIDTYDRPQAPRHPTQEDGQESDDDGMDLDDNDTSTKKDPDDIDFITSTSPTHHAPGSTTNTLKPHTPAIYTPSAAQTPTAADGGNTPSWGQPPRKPDITQRPARHELRKFVGTSPIDDYEISNTVGEGTFGLVTVGKNKITGTIVALKKISMKNEKEGLPVTALREIKILKMMSHPNVIQLLEIATKKADKNKSVRGEVYMVFPYMDHDLSGIIESDNIKLTPSHIKSYMKQLLEGTAYLHQVRLIHRDMKTANILIDNHGNLRLADFGLARTYNPDEKKRRYTNMVVTRWYRPPELILGDTKYGPSVDMWGIGCVFGEMLRRQPILPGGGGKDEETASVDQLKRIFSMRGIPTVETWPDWDKLPKWASFGAQFKEQYRPQDLAKQFEKDCRGARIDIDESGLSLLAGLLILNPRNRLTADKALLAPYFTLRPYAARPGTSDFPQWEPSHELDARKRREAGGGHRPPAAAQPQAGFSQAAHRRPDQFNRPR
ncbi:hypothetical protein SmJEL517_g04465 [Synchytrium microbalum]|uniref:Protein kinase domain-containing protein n=1 Tax=Synchytrium microbalum TaxID=1806994 RepID=A0A507C392_9FUNG|nr:uncharacterized protein SmJEL517_g04465 [Synchytrium microbalum]TPX32416.1 hypothetical protein SmJEL517_g04465 [Synchytrium microbalum]